jgi:hypothetical protein
MRTSFSLGLVAGLFAAAVAAQSARAAIGTAYNVDLFSNYTYGMNDQNYEANNFGPTACGPTSTVNSFLYLQDRYGFTQLVPHIAGNTAADDASAAINTLGGLMGLSADGVTDGNFVAGKRQYIRDVGLQNQISVEVQAANAAADPSQTTPTWQFLYDQLRLGQDVEVGFNWLGTGGGGHWVTATSLSFIDANSNGTIDNGETATMDFVDPWGGVHLVGDLSMGGPGNNYLVVAYTGGAAGAGNDPLNPGHAGSGYIDIIVAESKVPEPATLGLLGGAVGALMLRRRR